MEIRDEKKNIHFNPDFIARRSKTPATSKFHVNPAFINKSNTPAAYFQSVQQNLLTEENIYTSNNELQQTSSVTKPLQVLPKATCTSLSESPPYPNSNYAGSSSSLIYNSGDQRPVYVNSQSRYSASFPPNSQVSCKNSVNSSIHSVKTNPMSLNPTRPPVIHSIPSKFTYQKQSEVKNNFYKFNNNVSRLTKSKFKIDKRRGTYEVGTKSKPGFEKYCFHQENEEANDNVFERTSSFKYGRVDSSEFVKSTKPDKYMIESIPLVKRNSAYFLSNVNDIKRKPNPNTSNLVLSNPIRSDQALAPVKKESSDLKRTSESKFTEGLSNSRLESKPVAQPVKSSNILINPILLKSLSSNDKVDIVAIASKCSPKKIVPSLPSSDQKSEKRMTNEEVGVLKPSPNSVSKYKVFSKTKLERRRSKSFSKTELTTPAKDSRSFSRKKDGSFVALCRPSPVFPTRPHSILAKNHPKRRDVVISRNKLVRRLSGSNFSDFAYEKQDYSVKTKTKLVKNPSGSSGKGVKDLSTLQNLTTDHERRKNYMVLSDRKLVRRKSGAGISKPKVSRDTNKTYTNTIIKPHKLVRNAPVRFGKVTTARNLNSKTTRINTKYKIENRAIGLSAKQKAAKGIVSKYRINRLKVDSPAVKRGVNKRFTWVSTRGAANHLQENRKRASNNFSDRFVNIGGILYKATKTSLHKQTAKKQINNVPRKGSRCIVKLHGNQYSVSAGGRTLTRMKSKPLSTSSPVLSRVHIGGLTYSRTKTGHYELTKAHQARAVLSSAKHRSMITLSQKKRRGSMQKRNQYCIFFNRFGRCTKKDKGDCPYLHDPNKVAICTRFLRGRCPVSNCPFSHKIDPEKMPVCSHFARSICIREDCPYRHVRVSPNAPICLDFLHGHCPINQECKKQHVLECEEFSTSGKCPRGEACPLSHRKGSRRKMKSISLEPIAQRSSQNRIPQKWSKMADVLGETIIKPKRKKAAISHNGVMPKRYFHVGEGNVSDTRDRAVTKEEQIVRKKVSKDINGEQEEETLGVCSHSDASGNDLEEQLSKSAEPKEEERPGALDLEQKREKMLQKIEKLREKYDTQSGSSFSNKQSVSDKNQSSKEICTHVTEGIEAEVEDFKCDAFERRPLPKKMPSFISFSREQGDVEDL